MPFLLVFMVHRTTGKGVDGPVRAGDRVSLVA